MEQANNQTEELHELCTTLNRVDASKVVVKISALKDATQSLPDWSGSDHRIEMNAFLRFIFLTRLRDWYKSDIEAYDGTPELETYLERHDHSGIALQRPEIVNIETPSHADSKSNYHCEVFLKDDAQLETLSLFFAAAVPTYQLCTWDDHLIDLSLIIPSGEIDLNDDNLVTHLRVPVPFVVDTYRGHMAALVDLSLQYIALGLLVLAPLLWDKIVSKWTINENTKITIAWRKTLDTEDDITPDYAPTNRMMISTKASLIPTIEGSEWSNHVYHCSSSFLWVHHKRCRHHSHGNQTQICLVYHYGSLQLLP